MAIAIVIAALIVAGGGVAAVLIATGGDSKTEKTTSAGAGRSTVAREPDGGSSTTDNADTPPAAETSASFEPFSAGTYDAEQPSGWTLVRDDEPENKRFVSRWKDGERTLVIDTTPGDSAGDPLESVYTAEGEISGDYERKAIRSTTIAGDAAAEWEFTLDGRRTVDIFFFRGGHGYAVLGSSPPGDFQEMAAITRHVAESIAPR